METLLAVLERRTTDAISSAFEQLSIGEVKAELTPCSQEEFGHYQCNSALRLSKSLKMNPRAVAQKIVGALGAEIKKICARIEIAGPGFINFTISSEFLSRELEVQIKDARLGAVRVKKQKVIVDFSSPNIAKELHVGHLRSTIIGDCLSRLFEFLGHDVLRLNHVGDWGTQFGMLITYMKEFASDVLDGKEKTSLEALMSWYRASKKRFDEDPAFQKQSKLEVVWLQSGDAESIKAWKLICDVSRKGFQEIYDLLGVRIQERGESFYNPFLKEVVKELEEKGLVTVSNGAKCIFLEGFKNREGEPLPLMIQKSDGGFNYDTTDMAAIRHRIFVEKADRIIVVTDNGQALHFQMIYAAAEKAGWLDPAKVKAEHVGHGLVVGTDGKKFKTRSGDTEKLIDLIYEGIEEAEKILQEKMQDTSKEEIKRLAKVVGVDAIKYADLSCHRTKDYTFSYERMLRFEGNTAVFLLYAYVRINGIKRKTHADMNQIFQDNKMDLQHPSEVSLGIHLRRFGEILESVASELLPNRLADYLYELANKFNAFYRDCRTEGTPEEPSRLILAELTARVLKQGLEILGLQIVDRM
jgi:arginyl-tRNA synthetase